jgi:predicted RNA-binding Zn ribbon-like protein
VPVESYAVKPPKLVGNTPCVDFINTVGWRGRPHAPDERLTDYAELVHWSVHVGAIGATAARALLAEARRRLADAAAVLATAIDLREALARLLLGGDARRRPGDLALLNELLARGPARTALVARAGEYRWHGDDDGDALEAPLWPIVWDASAVLASERRAWVRGCGDAECGWMFLDRSRTQTRVWCSMEGCGNRAKARRHYARQARASRRA